MTHLWLRAESRPNEARSALTPGTARRLIAAGLDITVERSPQRAVPDETYAAAGCSLAAPGAWREAPRDALILGLKDLPDDGTPLVHRHIMFGHAFKGQPDGRRLLARFAAGGGRLYDLEYLTDDSGRRIAAFGYWAGYAGAALSLLAWAAQARGGRLGPVSASPGRDALLAEVADALAGSGTAPPSALIVGALGRVGTGAADLCHAAGIGATLWDTAETARGGPFPEVLAHDLFLNCVLALPGVPVFVPADTPRLPRRLRVIGDIACDPGSDFNPVPVYDQPTDWTHPVRRLHDAPPLDVMAIDNLPALLPQESTEDFAAQLEPALAALAAPGGLSAGPWGRAAARFDSAMSDRPAATTAGRAATGGRIHWCGTGLSAVPGLRDLLTEGRGVTVWNRSTDKAHAAVGDLTGDIRGFDPAALETALAPGDIVVSMLPGSWHVPLAELAIASGAQFVSSSYISPQMRALDPAARAAGVALVNEVGLDPGIDHLMAHRLVADWRGAAAFDPEASLSFISYCGGVPKHPNPFRYKFSWSPLGVLTALAAPATSLRDGVPWTVQRPWDGISRYTAPLPEPETFEVYPNRDSLPYRAEYGFDPDWKLRQFVRGTLRLDGWAEAWAPVFDQVAAAEGDAEALRPLAEALWRDHAYGADEPDRVVLCVGLRAEREGRILQDRTWVLDAVGDARGSAMARLVSGTVALAVRDAAAGALAPGVQAAPSDPALVDRWLATVADLAQTCTLVDRRA